MLRNTCPDADPIVSRDSVASLVAYAPKWYIKVRTLLGRAVLPTNCLTRRPPGNARIVFVSLSPLLGFPYMIDSWPRRDFSARDDSFSAPSDRARTPVTSWENTGAPTRTGAEEKKTRRGYRAQYRRHGVDPKNALRSSCREMIFHDCRDDRFDNDMTYDLGTPRPYVYGEGFKQFFSRNPEWDNSKYSDTREFVLRVFNFFFFFFHSRL